MDKHWYVRMWEDYRGFGVEEWESGVAGIYAEIICWLQSRGETRRVENGLPEGFEGYVDGSNMQEAGDVGRRVRGVWGKSERQAREYESIQLRMNRACRDID